MVHAPEITDYVKNKATELDAISDEVDAVNIYKLKEKNAAEYAAASKFDAEKDKAAFRQYEDACDRVKNFYAVSSGNERTMVSIHTVDCHWLGTSGLFQAADLHVWRTVPGLMRKTQGGRLTLPRSSTPSRLSSTTCASARSSRTMSALA